MFSPKKTKIIATIGPASEQEKTLEKLISLGVDGARLNLSHGSHQEHGRVIQLIRKIEKKLNKHVAIMVDVQGPKIRIGNLPETGVELKVGSEITIDTGTREFYENRIPLPSLLFRDGTKDGHLVFLDDGAMQIKIISKYGGIFKAIVTRGGILFSKKGVNVPELENTSSILNAKDKIDIEFAVKSKVEYIALSFIRNAKDVKGARKFLGKAKTKIIAKIERPEALVNLEEITDEADAIMIARGDLGIETPLWELPIRQKEIIESARKHMKPVIVATQMLDSMIRNPLPTRAEVSDVANAVFDSADAVMLSGESAMGKYPTEAVDMMRKILEASSSSHSGLCEHLKTSILAPISLTAAKSAVSTATQTKAKAIILEDADDSLIRAISYLRTKTPVIAVSNKFDSVDPSAIVWGITPLVTDTKDLIRGAKTILINMGLLNKGDSVTCVHKKENAITTEII